MQNNTCIICLDEYENKIIFDCNHEICLICYEKILNWTDYNILCPICREKIDIKQEELNINELLCQRHYNYVKILFIMLLLLIIFGIIFYIEHVYT